MNFGEVLSRAWNIIWKHKILWIFGILAGCATTSTGSSNYRVSRDVELTPQMQRFVDQITEPQIVIFLLAAFVFFLVLVALFIFLGTIGRVGLIRGTSQADQERTPIFGELFSGSMPYFWRVFLLNLIVGIAVVLAAFIFLLMYFVGSVLTLGVGFICLIPMLCLLIPLFWAIGLILEQANIAIVVEDLSIMEGLKRGWGVIKTNPGEIIVMWLILGLGVGLLGGFIIGIPMSFIAIPAIFGALSGSEGAMTSGFWMAGLCFVGYIPIVIVLSGVMRAYIEASWTLTFLRLTKRAAVEVEPTPELVE